METIEEQTKGEASISSQRICLLGDVVDDSDAIEAAHTFGVPVIISNNGLEILDDQEWRTYFVLNDFEGSVYEALHKNKQTPLGPPALKYAAARKEGLPHNARPIYCYSMRGVVTCLTGIRKKDELTKLVRLIHWMGGCIRKDMNSNVTHLISIRNGGEKYQYAKTFRLTVVRPAWVYAAWERRKEIDFSATYERFTAEHRLKAFEGQKICLFGFPEDEYQHMVEVLIINGGMPADLDDAECSHVVVDKHAIQARPEPTTNGTQILKSDWFWYTIQNGYADEVDFLFGDCLDKVGITPNTEPHDALSISFNKRKRKCFSQLLQLEVKRRSSVSNASPLSFSGSFLDCTTSPKKLEGGKLLNEPEKSVCEPTVGEKSMRFHHFMDFFSTESNYVGILDTILKLFKIPLEERAETNDSLLNMNEIKAIFGAFPPIHEVHQTMLSRLRAIYSQWSEDCLIGEIILQVHDDLITAYPPYINFFEHMKESLQLCDAQNPRFHAFLKINQAKPECGRQSLQELMIRPVQRLPSISLLLKDILKHTNTSNPDYAMLEEALKAIKEVMMHINEEKRKTETRMAIFKDIEGCPPSLASPNRSLLSKCEVTELSNNWSGHGDSLAFYLFSDTIEVCKKNLRQNNSAKSSGASKSHKHVKLISLDDILHVVDITDSPRAFALVLHQDKEKFHTFGIVDEEIDKALYLKTLCKQMAEHACRADRDKALVYRTSQEIEVELSDHNLSTFSKAFKMAARTGSKVGRALSFNKTPSKLKRAVSTMMASPFGSRNSLTPSSKLAQMLLASCPNIYEVADEGGNSSRSSRF